MLGKAVFVSMVDYHRQVNERLLELAAALSDEALDAEIPGSSRSIRRTARHMAATDGRWRTFLETHKRAWEEGADDQYATIAEIAALQAGETAALTAWLEGQTEDDLLQPVEIVWDGEVYTMAPWHGLLQLLLHGQQHRAELAAALTQQGASPNDIDYIMYV